MYTGSLSLNSATDTDSAIEATLRLMILMDESLGEKEQKLVVARVPKDRQLLPLWTGTRRTSLGGRGAEGIRNARLLLSRRMEETKRLERGVRSC